jgi:hypothetical protein
MGNHGSTSVTLIRMSGGNFRLLTRLLTQVERILKVNQIELVS